MDLRKMAAKVANRAKRRVRPGMTTAGGSGILVSQDLTKKLFEATMGDDFEAIDEELTKAGFISFYNEGETDAVFEAGAELGMRAAREGLQVVVSYGEQSWGCVAASEQDALAMADAAIASVRQP